MIFNEILPSPALKPFVQNYLLVHLDYVPPDFQTKPYPTRIEQALVFFARGYIESHDPQSGIVSKITSNAFFGQQVSRLNFRTFSDPDFLMLMVIFRPGAMYRLLGFSSNELTNEFCNAELMLNAEIQSVNDQIANARTYKEVIERAEAYLLRRLRTVKIDAHPIDRIGELLFQNPTPFSLDWLADQSNLSSRQFERKFVERMGVGPKLYSRISRFHQVFMRKEMHPDLDWLTIAVQYGYSDYNHLAKDFRQFANVTPNVMISEYAHRPEIVITL
ncbi:AraC family transcriptional regulator [Spirosoma sp. BT702]|uniref:AraC family transcriptional regulator n=1 Tax=Spirosoma profusum TaxID=2771354 RepID=A0A927GA92_9BACT|nr:AraC family transcriptional regulator [Spirosoma profusum]MBD2705366.1 AraC family transcriptional regulator [Spirosoma profusum]